MSPCAEPETHQERQRGRRSRAKQRAGYRDRESDCAGGCEDARSYDGKQCAGHIRSRCLVWEKRSNLGRASLAL